MNEHANEEKKIEIGSIITIAMVLFANLVIENSKYLIFVILILILSIGYTIFLARKNKENIIKTFSNYSILWILLFAIEMFFYGYFGEDKSAYSLKYHILNIFWLVIVLFILNYNSKNMIRVIAKSASIVIIMMSIFIICTNYSNIISVIFDKDNIKRIGYTAVGNVNTTAVTYIFLLIPVLYEILVNKNKKYIPIAILDIIFMLLTGSKKGIISLILMIGIIAIGKATSKKKLIKSISIIGIAVLIICAICYLIPILHELIWNRFEAMINSVINFDINSQSSTNLRIKFILTALQKAWDKPFFGHGWSSFANLYGYTSLYDMNLYTHNNYAEVLFSFGLAGFFLYYWFPIKNIKDTVKSSDLKEKKILNWIYIIVLLFIDLGTVSCYSTIISFLGFAIVELNINDKKSIQFAKLISKRKNINDNKKNNYSTKDN